ncbi:hypothetical protein AURANDRAFT_20488, partial [Aureococcus anophagefferens]
MVFTNIALHAPDQLRQRVAWSLSQVYVVGVGGVEEARDEVEVWLKFYDIFVEHAFGNLRDVLRAISFSPVMAVYLTYLGSRQFDGVDQYPDENYAREFMQLFTIGLRELRDDQRRATGVFFRTYDNDDIATHARAWTGFDVAPLRSNVEAKRAANYVDDLRVHADRRDPFPKRDLYGGYIGDRRPRCADLDPLGAGSLFVKHSNTPPFFARHLIQRMVTSNPSPRYVAAVADAFRSGAYDGRTYSGAYGDIGAAVAAALSDREARSATILADPTHGRLREPLLKVLHFARAMELSPTGGREVSLEGMDQKIGQMAHEAPSVFSYYLPDYSPQGAVGDRGLVAPE